MIVIQMDNDIHFEHVRGDLKQNFHIFKSKPKIRINEPLSEKIFESKNLYQKVLRSLKNKVEINNNNNNNNHHNSNNNTSIVNHKNNDASNDKDNNNFNIKTITIIIIIIIIIIMLLLKMKMIIIMLVRLLYLM